MTSSPYQRAGGATLPRKKSRILTAHGPASGESRKTPAADTSTVRGGHGPTSRGGAPGEPAHHGGVPLGDRANPTCWCYLVATRGDAKGRLTHAVGRTPARWLGSMGRWAPVNRDAGLCRDGDRALRRLVSFFRGAAGGGVSPTVPTVPLSQPVPTRQQRYHELEAKLGARLAAVGLDLSRFPEGQRRAIVERYRDWDQQLAALADQLADLQRAEGLRATWTRWFEQERVLSYPLPAAGAKNP